MIIRGLGRWHAPILRSHQRLFRVLKVTVIVQMLRGTTLTIRIISRSSFLLRSDCPGAFLFEARMLHLETRPAPLNRKLPTEWEMCTTDLTMISSQPTA